MFQSRTDPSSERRKTQTDEAPATREREVATDGKDSQIWPSDERKSDDAKDEGLDLSVLQREWASSPENIRSRGQYIGFLALAISLLYGGLYAFLQNTTATDDPRVAVSVAAVGAVGAGGLLALVAFVRRQDARAAFYERQQRAATAGVDDALSRLGNAVDLRGLLVLNRRQMQAYETLTREQAASSYRLSHIALGVGLVVVVAGAVASLTADANATKFATAALAGIATAVSGYIARTYLRIYERTLVQLNFYFEQPLVSSYVLTAERLVQKMKADRRDDALGRIVDHLLANVRTGEPPSSQQTDA